MSDTDKPALTNAPQMYVHYCEIEGCKEWGGWGNSPSPAMAARWWCFEHFPTELKINASTGMRPARLEA